VQPGMRSDAVSLYGHTPCGKWEQQSSCPNGHGVTGLLPAGPLLELADRRGRRANRPVGQASCMGLVDRQHFTTEACGLRAEGTPDTMGAVACASVLPFSPEWALTHDHSHGSPPSNCCCLSNAAAVRIAES